MAAGPQRLPEPAAHVTAHIAPVERALNERARSIEERAEGQHQAVVSLSKFLAAEFRALAAELHHWP